MSDVNVTMILFCNQFNLKAELCVQEPPHNDYRKIAELRIDECAALINQCATMYQTNSLVLVGDNCAFLEGVKETIQSEYTIKYNNALNINIIAG